MIENFEEDYLQTVSDKDVVKIQPYNPLIKKYAEEIMIAIKAHTSGLDIRFMGASALGIAGQNDIDLYLFTTNPNLEQYLTNLIKALGNPEKISDTSIKWAFRKQGFDVEVHLTNPKRNEVSRQIKVFEMLKDNLELRNEYEHIKLNANGQNLREYQRRKFEFYNKILSKNP